MSALKSTYHSLVNVVRVVVPSFDVFTMPYASNALFSSLLHDRSFCVFKDSKQTKITLISLRGHS